MPYKDAAKKKANDKKYYAENRTRIRAVGKEYSKKNADTANTRAKKWYRKNRDRRVGYDLHRHYGITLEQYEQMLAEQDGACAICKRLPTKRTLAVDHNHDTGRVRGLLCAQCNLGIGGLQDSLTLVLEAAQYLRREGLPL